MPATRMPLIAVFVGLVVLTLTPATAQEATSPCPPSETYAPVGVAGLKRTVTPSAIPAFPHDILEQPYREEAVTRFLYRLDLSGSAAVPDAMFGDLTVTLTWDNRSDFDLWIYDSTDSELGRGNSFNPQTGVGKETVLLAGTSHCTDLRIDVVNYLGLPNSAMQLELAVANLA